MPFTPCDAVDFTFACNVNASACRDANPPFYVPKGSGIILRGDQVAPLEAPGASVAILVEPTTTLYPAKDSSDKTKVTVTATSTVTSGGGFTAADVAGAAVGVGAPLLVAMVCMIMVIIGQRRRLKEAKNVAVEREKVDRDAYMRYQPALIQPAPTYSSSPISPPSIANQQYGRFQEMENNHINEMSNDGVLSEMDALSNRGWKPPGDTENPSHYNC
jgi:hypothetical protein